MTYRDLFRFENDETTPGGYSKFKIDGTILLHYLDECHELVVLPDRVLDD